MDAAVPPFRVKICGVTTPGDARDAAAAGADAIGLNFVAGSPRCLSIARAIPVAAAIPRGVLRVGVFVGADADAIRGVAQRVGLDAVQLHGHWPGDDPASADPPEVCAALAGIAVVRAVRLGAGRGAAALDDAREWVRRATDFGHRPALVLVDASPPRGAPAAALGGSGVVVDWHALREAGPLPVPIGLAGGLRPGSVAEAILTSGAVAVDAASGVETAPGRKDAAAMRDFVAAARTALARG